MQAICDKHGRVETIHLRRRETPYDMGQCPLCVQEGHADPTSADPQKLWPFPLEPIPDKTARLMDWR